MAVTLEEHLILYNKIGFLSLVWLYLMNPIFSFDTVMKSLFLCKCCSFSLLIIFNLMLMRLIITTFLQLNWDLFSNNFYIRVRVIKYLSFITFLSIFHKNILYNP